MQALVHKGRPFLDKPRLLPCVTKWLRAKEENSYSKRFGNLTPALVAQTTKIKIRMASTGGLDSQTLDEGVEELSLSAVEGQKATFSRDELWMIFGPETLKAEKGISDKKAV